MAVNQVQMIAPQDSGRTSGGRKSGGKVGSQIGTVAGGVIGGLAAAVPTAAAVAATGGAAAPVAPSTIALGATTGALAGNALGGMIGESVQPGREGAIQRRIQSNAAPQVQHSEQSAQLRQSIMALHSQPPEIQQQYAQPLVQSYMASIANDKKGSGVA